MPPSWIRSLQESVAKVPPEAEHLDWTRSMAQLSGGLGSVNVGDPNSIDDRASAPTTSGMRPSSLFNEGMLKNLPLPGEVTTMTYEPLQSLLAVGTTAGSIHVFGGPAVQLHWYLRPASKVKHLLWKPGSALLIAADIKDNLSIFDISRVEPTIAVKAGSTNPFDPSAGPSSSGAPHPDTPMRIGAHSVRNSVITMELSPSHSHLFLGLRDGTVDAYDLDRLCPSPYRVPNLWWEEEEILRKSGVPDAPSRLHIPMIIDIATRPNDIGQLLLAYEGGVILLDIKERAVLKTFQLRLLPGAPGAGGGDSNTMWTERSSPITAIAWRPDGAVFVAGHEDGCLSFWWAEDDEKPLAVRTLDALDVDKPVGFETMMDQSPTGPREPIFKLAWSAFPEQGWLNLGGGATSGGAGAGGAGSSGSNAPQAPTKGTILTILGGMVQGRDPPGVACLHLPPYSAPLNVNLWGTKSAEAVAKTRTSLQSSLEANISSRYATPSVVEDFLLLPRANPHYGMAYDPFAVVFLLAADERLPTLPPPAAARGLSACVFPPTFAAPTARNPVTPILAVHRPLNLPLPLSVSGSGAILGAKIIDLGHSLANYRKLTGTRDVTGGASKTAGGAAAELTNEAADDEVDDLKLRGGEAKPQVVGSGGVTETPESLARILHYRILVTWHLDGTVRFHDASPHLLLLGKPKPGTENEAGKPEVLLRRSFPNPLPHLTIDVRHLILHPHNAGVPSLNRLRAQPMAIRIRDVQLSTEVLETTIVLRTSQLLHFRFGFARVSETQAFQEDLKQELEQDKREAAELAHASMGGFHHAGSSTSPRSPTRARLSGDVNELTSSLQGLASPSASSPRMPQAPRSPQSPTMGGEAMSRGPSSGSTLGPPPPRPRRDPKRLSAALQSAVGRASVDSSAPPGRSSISSDQPPRSLGASPNMAAMPHLPPVAGISGEEEITQLGHLATWSTDGFKPNILIDLSRGDATAWASCNVGFLAIACGTGFALFDLRGPETLHREGFSDGRDNGSISSEHSREARKAMSEEAKSPISHLCFAMCRSEEEMDEGNEGPSLKLVVTRASGFTTVFKLHRALDIWNVQRMGAHHVDELAEPLSVGVFDRMGASCEPTPQMLQLGARHGGDVGACVMLGVSREGITTRLGITGPRIAAAAVGERVLGSGVAERNGEKALLVVTESSIRIYSLPHLDIILRLQRHNREHGTPMSDATFSFDKSGDFVEHLSSLDVRLWTIFALVPRPGPARLDLFSPSSAAKLPMHPGALSGAVSSVASWLGGKSSSLTAGAILDEVLAGPKRPEPPSLPEPKHVVEAMKRQEAQARQRGSQEVGPSGSAPTTRRSTTATPVAGASAAVNQAHGTAAWNVDLAKQRGEMMTSLEDGLSSLERGVNDWVKSTKSAMVTSAAKDKFSKAFGL